MVEIVILTPLATGILAFFLPRTRGRALLPLTGAVHLVLSVLLWVRHPEALFAEYFAVTPEGLLSLLVISLLFFLISIYTTGYLKAANLRSERVFTGSMLVFLSTMTMVTLSDHIMVMWIAIEATTLASAPLIYTHRSAATLEATWKYVLICSVGIALALLGSVLITLSMDVGGVDVPVAFSALAEVAKRPGSAVAQSRVCLHPGGLWNQDGARADAHLAAGCPQRSPEPGLGAPVRCAAQLRLPGDLQNQQDHARRRVGRFFRHDSDRLRAGVHPGGGNLHSQTDRIQAPAGLFEHREHGDHRLRHRRRRTGRLRRRCCA